MPMLLAAALLAVAGCGPGADGADTSSRAEATVLRRGNGGAPGSLDPALAEDIHAFNVLTDLYEGLVTTDAAGRLVPGVAESWQVHDDGRGYDFRLRADARWSNGDPVVAADFVRAFRRVARLDPPAAYGFLLEPLEHFAEVRAGRRPPEDLGAHADGPRLLRLRLNAPAGHFLAVLTMPIAYPLPPRESRAAAHGAAPGFVGNGAYLLRSADVLGPVRLARNPRFRAADSVDGVSIDEIVYFPITDEQAELNMYRSGELDLTHTIPGPALPALRRERPSEVRIAPMLAFYYLALDLSEPPLNDPRLREALSLAVDRERLADIVGRGELPAYAVVPPGVAGYQAPAYEWRTLAAEARHARARALAEAAGVGPGGSLRLRYTYDTGDVHERIALAVADMWQETLGLEVELDRREWQYFLDTRDRREEWQVMRFSWFGDYEDPLTFLELFHSDSPQNLPGYNNPEYDRLVGQAAATVAANLRERLFAEAEAQLLADYPIIPLYFYVSKHLVAENVLGFESNVLDRHPSRYLSISDGR